MLHHQPLHVLGCGLVRVRASEHQAVYGIFSLNPNLDPNPNPNPNPNPKRSEVERRECVFRMVVGANISVRGAEG